VGGTQGEEDPSPLGYKALEEICHSKAPEDGILELAIKRERFEALLKSSEIRRDLMQLIIRAIHLCCLPNGVRHHAEDILRLVIETKFLTVHVSSFISRMLSYVGSSREEFQPSDTILRLAKVFLEFLQRFGREIVHSIPVFQLEHTVAELKARRLLQNTATLENRVRQVKELHKKVTDEEFDSVWRKEEETEDEPPCSFRELSVFPQAADLSVTYQPFLRVNVVRRRYRDLEHYLDVQFRLVRADFILPLREGIHQLRKDYGGLGSSGTHDSKETKDVQFYRDVTVLYPVCSAKGMVYRIRFDAFHHSVRNIPWEKCKRLKFGSLLCLSADDFYTPLFATVESRDPKELCSGELDVRFEGVELDKLNRFIEDKTKFDMVESQAFFEAYRYVLETLKEIKPDSLPFQEHIVECKQDVDPPDHERKTQGFYDMSGIANDDVNGSNDDLMLPSEDERMDSYREGSLSTDGGILLNAYDLRRYRDSLGFNDSQLRAFQLALTNRFAIIQGPPGTGKTYVGLKIARVLLDTASLWEDEEDRSPILMVSYTNHALDQFLEGLLPMTGIVRVGGRSKSEKLEPCMLRFLREQARESREIPGRIARARTKARKKMREIRENGQLELSIKVLKYSRRGIMSYHVLKQFMSERHAKWFEKEFERHDKRSASDLFCEWLGVERRVAAKDFRDRDDYGPHKDDFQMQVSFRSFANEDDVEEDETSNAIKPSEVVICETEDTRKPTELRKNLQGTETMSEDEEKCAFLSQRLSQQHRWNIYRLWMERAEKHYLQQVQTNQPEYERLSVRTSELTQEENLFVLQKARVIGMTTTGAGKHRRILQRIRPKIVLVEEAAEVLEGHIITSLTQGCEHLILIGDHQQLRPTPAVYELAKKYKLDVSLFERMVKAGIQCERLSVQHRMRPEIAALMKHIYEDLENHESVEKYEDIKGMKKNMFFIAHNYLEMSCDQTHSHVNEHEARYLVALCRYLLQQGYRAHQITLLTTYMGQMFAIREFLREEEDQAVRSVRLTTVDNFQGEENDIILLSLVRSNKTEKVGFIKVVNRACVALSRAKKGFYCIGNFALLSRHSDIWGKIVADLKASESIGKSLRLVCQIHGAEVSVKSAKDFKARVPNGGCERLCKVRLECGHSCKQRCHPYDVEHKNNKCVEPCLRNIKGCSHPCVKLCFQECETNCQVMVQKALPLCGHTNTVRCGGDLNRVHCKAQCEKVLRKCGHRCQKRCGEPCTQNCQTLVKKTDWPCCHDVRVACSTSPVDCPVRCSADLECGHQCSGTCGECRMGRIHKRCRSKCGRLLVCSHECTDSCIKACSPCSRKCENRCHHSDCKKTCGEPCVPCRETCMWECRHYKCSRLCGELCDRPRCNEPCNQTLVCGRGRHICRGLCGELCICALCEKNDDYPITEIFFGEEDEDDTLFVQLPDCKHIFAVAGLDRYMDMSEDENQVIQLKSCPRCSTPIRTSLRYGNVIKQRLQDIEKVKVRANGHPREMDEIRKRLQTRLADLERIFNGENEMTEWRRLERSVERMTKATVASVTENQVTLMERFCVMNQKLNRHLLEPRGKPSAYIRVEVTYVLE